MKPDDLQIHIFATYANLRIGVVAIAILFPFLLWGGGAIHGISLPDSMSAYYHVTENGKSMRNWFVGILFALGIILYLYKGYSHQENYALNVAGVFAIGIAIFPMEWDCGEECNKLSAHGVSAVLFFLSVAYVCLRCASDTLDLMNDENREKRYRMYYRLIGAGLICSPLIAVLMTFISQQSKSYTFMAETAGIWVFGSYWLLKSWEIASTNAERLALSKDIKT
jgi:hypothetical protein